MGVASGSQGGEFEEEGKGPAPRGRLWRVARLPGWPTQGSRCQAGEAWSLGRKLWSLCGAQHLRNGPPPPCGVGPPTAGSRAPRACRMWGPWGSLRTTPGDLEGGHWERLEAGARAGDRAGPSVLGGLGTCLGAKSSGGKDKAPPQQGTAESRSHRSASLALLGAASGSGNSLEWGRAWGLWVRVSAWGI